MIYFYKGTLNSRIDYLIPQTFTIPSHVFVYKVFFTENRRDQLKLA